MTMPWIIAAVVYGLIALAVAWLAMLAANPFTGNIEFKDVVRGILLGAFWLPVIATAMVLRLFKLTFDD